MLISTGAVPSLPSEFLPQIGYNNSEGGERHGENLADERSSIQENLHVDRA